MKIKSQALTATNTKLLISLVVICYSPFISDNFIYCTKRRTLTAALEILLHYPFYLCSLGVSSNKLARVKSS